MPEPGCLAPSFKISMGLLPPEELGPLIDDTWNADATLTQNLYVVVYTALELALSRTSMALLPLEELNPLLNAQSDNGNA